MGYCLNNCGIEVDQAKIEIMTGLPSPTTVKDVNSFSNCPHRASSRLEFAFRDNVRCERLRYRRNSCQKKDKKLHAIYYASKTLDHAQRNYAITEKELLAVVFTFGKFRSYLVGSKVVVHTGYVALKYLMQKKDAKP
ncbi:hypothetical protein Bca101_097502 [Brassica carinata]